MNADASLIVAAAIAAFPGVLAAIGSFINGRRLKRVEHNTNGLVAHNAALNRDAGKREGMVEGAAAEKANPS